MSYQNTIGNHTFRFADLKILIAKASPLGSGDQLAEIAAKSARERVAAQMALADLPLKIFMEEFVIPYEKDEVTRLIVDSHDPSAFSLFSHLTVSDFRNWLLAYETDCQTLTK